MMSVQPLKHWSAHWLQPKRSWRAMRKLRRRFRLTRPAPAIRRHDDGRAVCLANEAGRAEYQRRKQLLWAGQSGFCALISCRQRMSLLEARMTHGNWQAINQLRDDRLGLNADKKPINQLVHKGCMAQWFELEAGERSDNDSLAAGCSNPVLAGLGN